ncbi:guanylate kinase [Hysterangium stoloniferum]|nr:guanylate kinase [Hysterangium stoloniferum]
MSPCTDFLRPLVISGPSGTGKSTLISRLFSEHLDKFDTICTPRIGEVEGKHYYFVPHEKFTSLLEEGTFIEHAQFSGNFYRTSATTVKDVAASGRRCLLDIDSQVCGEERGGVCEDAGVHDIVIVNDDVEKVYKAFENVALGDSDKVDDYRHWMTMKVRQRVE